MDVVMMINGMILSAHMRFRSSVNQTGALELRPPAGARMRWVSWRARWTSWTHDQVAPYLDSGGTGAVQPRLSVRFGLEEVALGGT